jgi:tetratricopeptide (TPR) repeat protein
MPHALRLLDTKTSIDAQSRAKLSFWVGRCLNLDGRVPEAVRWLEECLRCREVLDEDDPNRLVAQHALGVSYQANGRTEDAVRLLEHVVKVENDTLAETHPDQLASQHALSVSYQANGQTEDAVRLLEHVVKVRDATLAGTHPDRLASEGWLRYITPHQEKFYSFPCNIPVKHFYQFRRGEEQSSSTNTGTI